MKSLDFRGQTTLITGASSGIGAAFARELAARGSHVVLVARRADRLARLADELTTGAGVRATPIPQDLSLPDAGQRLAEEVARMGLSVTSLINNAGFGTAGMFHSEDPKRIQQEVAVNVASVIDISRAFIEPLRAIGAGVLVNVASVAAYQPIPKMAVYAASKAFLLSFTEALWYESRGTGLRVMLLSPGATRTEFNDVLGTEQLTRGAPVETPGQVVATALRALNRRNPPPSVVSGRLNRLSSQSARLLSRRRVVLAAGFATRSTG